MFLPFVYERQLMTAASHVWTIPSRQLQALPPVQAIAQDLHPEQPWTELLRRYLGHDTSVQTQALCNLPEATLAQMAAADRAALPHPEDRAAYFGDAHIAYWLSGLGDYLWLRKISDEHGRAGGPPGRTFLDFASSSGRVLRHFLAHEPTTTAIGTDIYANYIQWMRKYLPERGLYFQNTAVPHLPMEDASVDVIYGGSIFSHLDEFEEAWLLELRRILKPGGVAFVTIMSDRVWDGLNPAHPVVAHLTQNEHTSLLNGVAAVGPEFFTGKMPDERVVLRHVYAPTMNVHVFLSVPYIRRRWAQIMSVIDVIPEAHGPHQDGIVLRK